MISVYNLFLHVSDVKSLINLSVQIFSELWRGSAGTLGELH